MGLIGDGVLCILQAVVFVYDIVTFPLYTVVQRPWVARGLQNKERAKVISQDDQQITIEPIPKMCPDLRQFIDAGVDTMAKCFQVFIFLYQNNFTFYISHVFISWYYNNVIIVYLHN